MATEQQQQQRQSLIGREIALNAKTGPLRPRPPCSGHKGRIAT
jgi:hypothetical protein